MKRGILGRFLVGGGATSVLAGAVLVAVGSVSAGASGSHISAMHFGRHASNGARSVVKLPAAGTHLSASSATPGCGHQPNLDDPTNSGNQALTTYYFDITHNGVTSSFCRLESRLSAGDIVTVHFTPADPANPPRLSLVANYATLPSLDQQTPASCASNFAQSVCGSAASGNSLTVSTPNCGYQVDFIYGRVIVHLTQGTYRMQNRLIDGRTDPGQLATSCPGGGTPSPSPTVSASPSTSPSAPGSHGHTPGHPAGGHGSGVQGISTPDTGGMGTPAGLGVLLIALGAGSIVAGGRPYRKTR